MKTKLAKYLFVLYLSVFLSEPVWSAEPATALIGKDEWLFYRYEIATSNDDAPINQSINLIGKFSKILSDHGTSLLVTMVPIKIRIYSEYLPDEVKIDEYMAGHYKQLLGALNSGGVSTVDLNTAFMNDAHRKSDTPLFFRLDSHWTPTGAMTAAQAIKEEVGRSPVLQKLVDSTPAVAYSIKIANRKRASKGRDLVNQLPENSPVFAPEMVAQVNVVRAPSAQADLLGAQAEPQIALMGSSYSKDWTGFSDALRFVFQRDVTSVAVSADQGSWVGMESYLRDEAFQTNPPKLLIWELPERDMKAPPDYKFRETRYVMNNEEWLKRVSALVALSKFRKP